MTRCSRFHSSVELTPKPGYHIERPKAGRRAGLVSPAYSDGAEDGGASILESGFSNPDSSSEYSPRTRRWSGPPRAEADEARQAGELLVRLRIGVLELLRRQRFQYALDYEARIGERP